jgi:hypothetical protein
MGRALGTKRRSNPRMLSLSTQLFSICRIGHLTSLKHQLKELHIEDNDRINDDCIPSLCLFSTVTFLRIYGTSIKMPGLRRLAASVHGAGREIDIELPEECETYLNSDYFRGGTYSN